MLFVTALAVVSIRLGGASEAQGPHFEEASIRPAPRDAGPRTPMREDPSRVQYRNVSLRMLIQVVYALPDYALSGGPSWVDSELYDVQAILPAGASTSQVPQMLQSLLAERFQLVLRRETREMRVYQLVVAKGGPKLKPGDTKDQWDDRGGMNGGIFRGQILLHQLEMPGLAEILARRVQRPVLDATHLPGVFDVNLTWTPDDAAETDNSPGGVSLYAALEQQLGLKLIPAKAPVDVYVVAQAEKPTEN